MEQDKNAEIMKILFVDDEENVLRALKRLFMDEPYEVFTAQSGKEALEKLGQRHFSVIVSDQRMPEMSGSEFLARARELQPDAVRIVLTGYADVQAAIEAINKGGAYRYITKPWNDNDLVLVVRNAVETYNMQQENRRLTELTRRQNEELKQWSSQLEVMVQEQTLDIQRKSKDLEKLNEQLQKNFKKSIEAFSGLIELREKTVSGHSKNVAMLARQMAMSMKLADRELSNILVGALLHDIGKIGVPDAVLMKRPEEMNAAELAEYQRHPVRGQVAVDVIEGFSDIGLLIRHHHEHVDGTGFPDRLVRGEIPLGSRLVAMADAFDRIANINEPSEEGFLKALQHIEYYLDTRYDRTLYLHLAPIIKKKIVELGKKGEIREDEDEVHPDRLTAGMELTRDVRSGSGLLILAGGVMLDEKVIESIQRYNQMDPYRTGIFVRKSALKK